MQQNNISTRARARVRLDLKQVNFFEQIISHDSLFSAWNDFKKGKKRKADVILFEKEFQKHIHLLHWELKNKRFRLCLKRLFFYLKINVNNCIITD